MTATLDALGVVGDVRNLDLRRDDVTAVGADLDARLEALDTSIARLTDLMERADTVEDLLNAERELTWRQADRDSIAGQRSTLTDQVRMSTLDLSIQTEREAGPVRSGFLGGLASGWDSLVGAARGLLVGLGAALPWLAALAIAGGAATWAFTSRRRRATHEAGPVALAQAQPIAAADTSTEPEATEDAAR
jgi:hypothetical protein